MNKPFEPKPYQRAVFDEMSKGRQYPILQWGHNPYRVGIDVGRKDGDYTAITRMKMDGKGHITQIVFDEYADWIEYKWYRNPIKWYKLRKVMKILERQSKKLWKQ